MSLVMLSLNCALILQLGVRVRAEHASNTQLNQVTRNCYPNLAEREDILSLLVAARFEDGEPMSDGELRDQLMTLLIAGHETTATALAWTFDLLLRNPAVLARLRADLRDGARGVPAGDDQRRAAPAARHPARRPPAGDRLRARGPGAAARHRRHAGDLADPHPRRHLSRPARLPARALPRQPARDLLVDPVRRRHPPLPRRGLRRVRDARRAALGARALRSGGASSAPQRIARRNITFSPRNGTPVRLRSRAGAPKLAAA